MKKLSSTLIGLFLAILGSPSAMATEEPQFEVLSSDGDMELRRYAPMLIAETEVEGDYTAKVLTLHVGHASSLEQMRICVMTEAIKAIFKQAFGSTGRA